MHHIYTTKAIIIKSVPIGEANKYYFLLTEDLGFVRASAQSVRLEKSKLKGHLQDFCFIEVSLVKGKDIWRIIGVETIQSGYFINNINKLVAIKNIFSLLLRLLHGEEKNELLFNSIKSFYDFLLKDELSQNNIKNLETITVLRILYHLGYFKKSFDLSDYVMDDKLSIEILDLFESKNKIAILDINNALNETHL
ncbi:MAG: DNA repair protein RecO [Candidatus Paceibacterota bacterium]|jgi:DNA repair protein RecO (recombination protein O)